MNMYFLFSVVIQYYIIYLLLKLIQFYLLSAFSDWLMCSFNIPLFFES